MIENQMPDQSREAGLSTEASHAKLWYASSSTPYRNEGDAFAVVLAPTRDEAIIKAKEAIADARGNYVPSQRRLDGIDVDQICELERGALVTDGLR